MTKRIDNSPLIHLVLFFLFALADNLSSRLIGDWHIWITVGIIVFATEVYQATIFVTVYNEDIQAANNGWWYVFWAKLIVWFSEPDTWLDIIAGFIGIFLAFAGLRWLL